MSHHIVSAMFNVIEWKDEETAFIDCPGKHFHSTKNNKKDCRVNIDNAPTIFCLHSSCFSIIEEANYKMRRAIWDNNPLPKREFTEAERIKIKSDLEEKKKESSLREWAVKNKEMLLKKNEWLLSDVFHESPFMTENPALDSNVFLKYMYQPDDVIWIGQPEQSGDVKFKSNFRSVREWTETENKGNFTCPSVFKRDSFSRSNENVLSRPYIVVESDVLSLDQTCSLFKWMRRFLNLKAIIHSGGKSCHGWFEFPSKELFKRLRVVLPELGADWHLFTASQPVRMPGIARKDQMQCLYWFNP